MNTRNSYSFLGNLKNYLSDTVGGLKLMAGNAYVNLKDNLTDIHLGGINAAKNLNTIRQTTENQYPYTDTAKQILNKAKINYLDTNGQYNTPSGLAYQDVVPNVFQVKTSGQTAPTQNIDDSDRVNRYRGIALAPQTVDVYQGLSHLNTTEPKRITAPVATEGDQPSVTAHEFAHYLSQTIPEQTGKTINMGTFGSDWDKEAQNNRLLQAIDNRIMSSYADSSGNVSPQELNQERFAFLSEYANVGNVNPTAMIPDNLKPYYSTIYNFK